MRQAWAIIGLPLALAIASAAAGQAPPAATGTGSPGNFYLAQTQWNRTSYGAIAYSAKTGGWGAVSGKGSEQEAKEAALAACGQRNEGCELADIFSNTCAAVAALVRTASYTIAHSESRGKAEYAAKADCAQKFGGSCRVVASACSLP